MALCLIIMKIHEIDRRKKKRIEPEGKVLFYFIVKDTSVIVKVNMNTEIGTVQYLLFFNFPRKENYNKMS